MKLVPMEIGQKFLMQKENRKIQENEVSIHLFEDSYVFSDNVKSTYYKKSLFTKKVKPSEIESINLNETKVSFISFNKTSVFVPSIIFNEISQKSYFKKSTLNNIKFKTYFDKLNSNDIVNTFFLKENEALFNIFPQKKISIITHYKTILLNTIINCEKESYNDKVVYLNLQKKSFDIFYFINNKFNLSNSFNIKNTDEFLYYFFYFTEQFNLDSNSFSIVFLGKFETFKTLYSAIRDFQTNIFFLNNSIKNNDYVDKHPSPFLANYFC